MSWDIKLFHQINSLAGRNKWLDALGLVGSEVLVFLMGLWYVLASLIKFWPNLAVVVLPLILLAIVWFSGWVVDISIALMVRRPRPHVDHSNSQLLIKPIANWHSFPSDHTMSAFLICFLAIIFGLPFAWVLLPLAIWVALGRIFVGVHYPTDILGGLTIAIILAILTRYILKV